MIELNLMVGLAPFELKFKDIALEGMRFKMNSSNYHHVSPMFKIIRQCRLPLDLYMWVAHGCK